MTLVKRWVNVVEVVPNYTVSACGNGKRLEERTMAHDDAAHLILGHCAMHDEAKAQKHPW